MERGLHKLAFVSRLLLDKEVIELRQENERLRLLLFWKEHNVRTLSKLMRDLNRSRSGPQCACTACVMLGRSDESHDAQGSVAFDLYCEFNPWFERNILEMGMTVSMVPPPHGAGVENCDIDAGGDLYEVDSHFHCILRGNCVHWTYGARLWKAASADDPELLRLHALFETLDNICYSEYAI
jgi:hypothetical protein